MYTITSRVYKDRLNITTVNLLQEAPYRAFEVDVSGDVSELIDDEVILKAKSILAMEFSPDYGLGAINLKVDDMTGKLTKQSEAQEKILNAIIHISDLTDEQREGLINQYPTVAVGDEVEAGRVYNLDGVLYEANKSTSIDAENWIGDESIFKLYLAGETEEGQEIIHDWKQPAGGHDAYSIGDKVRFDGNVYESIIDGNVWSPADHPQGWKEVE